MVKKITLTEDHLKLIPFFYVRENDDEDGVEINSNQLYNLGSHLLEDMATILGLSDKAIPNTQDDPNGKAFDDETEQYLLGLHEYITSNLYYIETLIHQFAANGGLTVGTYKCLDNELIWSKEE